LEQGLGSTVSALLTEIAPDRVSPPMPDDGAGVEPQGPAGALQRPADVHVVSGGDERRIEAADRLEALLPERHVAARDVLGLAIREQDVHGPARRMGDA